MQMTAQTGPVYRLQYDQSGLEFICVRGQWVYFDDQQSIPNDQSGDKTYESGRQDLDAADSEDQRPMTEPRNDGENASGTTAKQPPPTTNSSDRGSTTDNGSDADNDSEESQQSKDSDPENQSDANRSNINDNESE